MTAAIWTLAIIGLILSMIGFKDIIKELSSFCREGVMSDTVFRGKRRGPSAPALTLNTQNFTFPQKINSSGLQAENNSSTNSEKKGKYHV